MGWFYLLFAGVFEVAFTTSLKYTEGFTSLAPSLIFAVAYAASAWFLAKSIQTIPLGTAYAVWAGIGVIGTAMVGVMVFGEPATALRLLFLGFILAGVIGLKVVAE
jgi:quaternary ammonium compound-resistance protein SugE